MNDKLYNLAEALLSRLKGRRFDLDRALPFSLLMAVVLRRSIWLLRGLLKGLVLQRRLIFVFVADGVTLRGASLIRFGRGVTLERGVTMDGTMRNGIVLGDHVKIGPYSTLVGAPISNLGEGIRIGANSAVDAYSFIGSSGAISVGENVIMGQHVCFHPENHNFDRTDIPIKNQGTTRIGITIEDDVWVGANVTFLDGAYVGRGSVLGAGSVVKGTIPPFSVAVGAPARVIRSRNPKELAEISSSATKAH